MLRRVKICLRANKAMVWLCFCTGVSFLAWAGNMIWPAPEHGYTDEISLLILIGAGAIWTHRENITGAVFLYCAGAVLPVGSMLQYQQDHGGGWSVLVLTPLVGIAVVAILTTSTRATLVYGLIALLASFVVGLVYNDGGQAGALMFLSGTVTALAVMWLGSDLQCAHKKLDELRGEASRLNQLEQETRTHDP